MAGLSEGDAAPEIDLPDERGERFRLSGLRGRKVVLYFYPRANTPGCTTEACEFRDLAADFAGRNAAIVGVSPDTPAAQMKFKAGKGLPFTLLADADRRAARAYGVWKQKNMYGKSVMGIERSTFVIGEDGRIEKIFRKVKAAGHAARVFESVR
jgi:thioredoxin-dependent peroxiredoxin